MLRKTNTGHQLYHEVGADLIFQGKLFQVDETLFFEDQLGKGSWLYLANRVI